MPPGRQDFRFEAQAQNEIVQQGKHHRRKAESSIELCVLECILGVFDYNLGVLPTCPAWVKSTDTPVRPVKAKIQTWSATTI